MGYHMVTRGSVGLASQLSSTVYGLWVLYPFVTHGRYCKCTLSRVGIQEQVSNYSNIILTWILRF